jgi:integration host factor subunit beta
LLGHGWITAEMSIERVLRGKAPSRVIQIRYLAHTFRGEGVPLRYRLRRDEDGTYMICVKPGETGVRCR